VPDGPLTSRLQHLKQGRRDHSSAAKATGTLVIDNLREGRNLYLIGNGTGLAPFLSVNQGPRDLRALRKGGAAARLPPRRRTGLWRDDYEKLPNDELIGELVRNQLIYYPNRDAAIRSATAAGSPT